MKNEMEQLMMATNIIESNFSSIIKQRDELKRGKTTHSTLII